MKKILFLLFASISSVTYGQIRTGIHIQFSSEFEQPKSAFGGDSILATSYSIRCLGCDRFRSKSSWEIKLNDSEWIEYTTKYVTVTECIEGDTSTAHLYIDSILNYDTITYLEYLDIYGFFWQNPEYIEIANSGPVACSIRRKSIVEENPYTNSTIIYSNVVDFVLPKLENDDYFLFKKFLDLKNEIPNLGKVYITEYISTIYIDYITILEIEPLIVLHPSSELSWIPHAYKAAMMKRQLKFDTSGQFQLNYDSECAELSQYDIDLVKSIHKRVCEN